MRNVISISLAFFFIFFGFGTAQQYLVVLFREDGRGDIALLSLFLLYGTFMLVGLAAAKIIPIIGGLKRSVMVGAITYALYVACIALGNAPILLVASTIIGFGAALLWVGSGQIIADNSNEKTAGRNFALQVASSNIANIVGMYAGGFLLERVSATVMFMSMSFVILVGFFFLILIRLSREEMQPRPFRLLFALDRRMLALFPLLFGSSYLNGQAFIGVNFIIVTFLGIGAIPLVISFFKLGNVAGSLSIGAISARVSKQTILLCTTIIILLGVGIFTLTSTLGWLLSGAILLGFSLSGVYPVTLAWFKDAFVREENIYALGILHVYSNLGMIAAISANAYLSPSQSFIPAAVILVVALPGIMLFRRVTQR